MVNLFEMKSEKAKQLDRWLDDNSEDLGINGEPVISVEKVDRELVKLVEENEKLKDFLETLSHATPEYMDFENINTGDEERLEYLPIDWADEAQYLLDSLTNKGE